MNYGSSLCMVSSEFLYFSLQCTGLFLSQWLHAGAISKDNCSVVFSSISDLRWFTRSNVSGVDSIAEEICLCSG